MKEFKGKAIYNPSGKAAEYSEWACNLYNGCSAKCEYCYNRHGITAKVLGADMPTLKKSLINEREALLIFQDELIRNADEIRKHGLFFNFVSDPCLKETYELNSRAWFFCDQLDIPVKILTKQTWWLENFFSRIKNNYKLFAIGFTLTGHDELEPGAASNLDRIEAMKCLYNAGYKTFASIEPIIDIESSLKMIREACNHVDLLKIGLQSGKSYTQKELLDFMVKVHNLSEVYGFSIYYKDSILKSAKIDRSLLSHNCVSRDYNLFTES